MMGMFAGYKIPTKEKLSMLSDQNILKEFVYDVLEALREDESCEDENIRIPITSMLRAPRTDANVRIKHEKSRGAMMVWIKTLNCKYSGL